ncbi:MAG TPA: sigma-54-dependent Fis family transcriptional regulator, partial [Alphaproteobacteria bacterium]|nr:sigma-54-dependent Fis family transcriptional regulator [Alphaproteobacteria bacterium]HAM48065.1 sigma-54-dependent Fis family transcriptional regulator [Alphaproteobacteria bacterium]HCO90115.1 sigma-54-dependent Fis family transcriptional regulator [Alphaproteobacteria bacterium]
MRLLIIGSLSGELGTASKMAMDRGARVSTADSIETALNALRAGRGADMLMVDIAQPIETLIQQLETEHIHIPVVACGIDASADSAAAAIRAGAKEYLPLPPDPDLIAAILEAVTHEDHQLICADPATEAVLKLADQVAPSDASIMITGESGTGKEIMAHYVHRQSKRANGPFISVNCAAIPD